MKLALLALLALVPTRADAECMSYGLSARARTPHADALPPDGNLIVYAEPVPGGQLDPGDPASIPGWKWKGGGKAIVKSIAPGLALLQPPQGNVELVDDTGKTKVSTKTSTAKVPLLAAPKLKAAVHANRQGRRGGEDVVVELEAAPPEAAIVIVLFDDKSKPKSWAMIGETTLTTVRAYSVGGCLALPNGTRPTKPGDLVRVAFVDDLGRMTAISGAVKVTAKPASPRSP